MRRLAPSEADADDLTQEVFVVVHRKLSGFEGRSKLSTWIYGICVRVAADHRRRAHVRHETTGVAIPESEVAHVQADALEAADARQALNALLAKLDEDKRAVFVLFELEEQSMAEVAAAVGVPLQTAYARLYAARRIIQEALAKGGPE
jgi:RNA polymerase sigma-70 factor (ECF subfamily)